MIPLAIDGVGVHVWKLLWPQFYVRYTSSDHSTTFRWCANDEIIAKG